MTRENMRDRFDWLEKVSQIVVERIAKWNR